DCVDCRHRRILDHLRHGVAPEAVALRGRRIGEHRQMTWGVVQARELEPGIGGRSFLVLRGEGRSVAAFEILPNGHATGGIVDYDEPPGLTQPYRGGKTREPDQTLQGPTRQRVASKASNVPAPDEEVAQTRAEALVEPHRLAGGGGFALRLHAPSLNAITIPRALAPVHAARWRRTSSPAKFCRHDKQDDELADLLERTQDIAGLAADLPDG